MRLAILCGLVCSTLGACTPEIASGAYLCGPEQLCPEGQACNGPDNTCVIDTTAQPFTCGMLTEVEPNDSASTAQNLGALDCVSRPVVVLGCAQGADAADWYRVHAPDTCTAVQVEARVAFPIAFEPLILEVRDAAGAVLATGVRCAHVGTSDDIADDQLCVKQTLMPGGDYEVRVARAGSANCGGACAYNRYSVTIQLSTP